MATSRTEPEVLIDAGLRAPLSDITTLRMAVAAAHKVLREREHAQLDYTQPSPNAQDAVKVVIY